MSSSFRVGVGYNTYSSTATATATAAAGSMQSNSNHLHHLHHHHDNSYSNNNNYSNYSNCNYSNSNYSNSNSHHPNHQSASISVSSVSISSMDEAYRRLGHKLSQRVTSGNDYQQQQQQQQHSTRSNQHNSSNNNNNNNNHRMTLDLGSHPSTAFSSNAVDGSTTFTATTATTATASAPTTAQKNHTHSNQTQSQSANELWNSNRSHKVAKMGYMDHGSRQGNDHDSSLLKKLTHHAKATFRTVERSKQQQQQQQKQQQQQQQKHATQTNNSRINGSTSPDKGIKKRPSGLPSVEQQQQQLQQQQRVNDNDNTSQLLSNNNNNKGLLGSVLETPPRQKCLTLPKEAVSNDGNDNTEGNLVVYEGDIIQPLNVHALKGNGIGTLRVIKLLGQGTFAQVFLCECQRSGHRIALKVVKNKQAYTRQAAIEIDVFRALKDSKVNMVQLESYFVHQNHLCLVFELLGLNLYEVLKQRQFRGLPLPTVRSLLQQAIDAVKDLSAKSIVHCDLKPENILLSSHEESDSTGDCSDDRTATTTTPTTCDESLTTNGSPTSTNCSIPPDSAPRIKLIDFGSACFEGNTAHTYIQSRFYRCPEVLVGLPYDSAIDMWSLGCVAAELFLGLPILPGVHEHDQLGRISEMIAPLPDWMLEQGSKSTKYFAKQFTRPSKNDTFKSVMGGRTPSPITPRDRCESSLPLPATPSWRIKTQHEYIQSLSASEIRKKGGLAKLEKQPANRYFKRKRLADIIILHGKATTIEEKDKLELFVHFLMGILDPDPWKRWTAFQASQHPFLTGSTSHHRRGRQRREEGGGMETNGTSVMMDNNNNNNDNSKLNDGTNEFGIHWVPPWDPSICRRKLLNVQKSREKQQTGRRGGYNSNNNHRGQRDNYQVDMEMRSGSDTVSTLPCGSGSTNTSKMTTPGVSLSRQSTSNTGSDQTSPPTSLGISGSTQPDRTSSMTGSLGSILGLHQTDTSGGLMQGHHHLGPPQNMATTDYGQLPGVVETRIPASLMMTGLSYGDVSMPTHSSMLHQAGPPSYSGMSYDGSMGPVEAEFGYALQRPGNVPATHELAGSYSSMGQHSVTSVGFSPSHHQLHQPRGLPSRSMPSALSSQNGGGTNSRHASVPMMGSRRGSRQHRYNNAPMPPMMSHSYTSMHNAPTSIREDSTDYQLGGGGPSVTTSGASLLAQQLEEQAAIACDVLRGTEVQQLRNHPSYARSNTTYNNGPVASSAPHHHGGGGCGYYTTYVAADGTPFLASSLDMHHQQAGMGQHGNTNSMGHMTSGGGPAYHHPGNFSDQHAPMHALQQQQYTQAPSSIHHGGHNNNSMYSVPAYLAVQQQQQLHQQQQQRHQQPTMEQLERARQKEAGLPPGSVYHRGLSM